MEQLKVSICVPVYGVKKFIKRCCESLFKQTYKNIEYIFVDDCSPDESVDIILGVLDNYDFRKEQVRIIRHKSNRGLAAARNSAINNALGDFILHIDSDDYIDKNLVEFLVKEQLKSSADIITSPAFYVYSKRKVLSAENVISDKEEYLAKIINRSISSRIWGRLIRKSLYTENGIHNVPGVNNSEDYQVFPQLLYFAHSVSWIYNTYYYYNKENDGSYTNCHKEENDLQTFQTLDILRCFFKRNDVRYLSEIEFAEIKILGWNLKHWCYVDGHDEFYNSLVEKLLSHKDKLCFLDWRVRLILYIKRSFWQFLYKILA